MSGAILEANVNNIVARNFHVLRGSFDVVFCFYLFHFFFEKLYLFQLVTQDIMYFEENAMVFFFY